MEEALRLREATVSAVCSKEYGKLASCIQQLAKLHPTVEVLQTSGIGHLVADRHLWSLAGHIVQRRADALQARWRAAFKHTKVASSSLGTSGPPKPFGGWESRAFLSFVKGFEKEAAATSPETDRALRRAVAVKAVLLGFTCFNQLAGTAEEDVIHFIPSPAARALFMRMAARSAGVREACRKRLDYVVSSQAAASSSSSSPSSWSTSSTSTASSSLASAQTLAATVKAVDPDKLQDAISKVMHQWEVPTRKGTPTAMVAALAAAQQQGEPVQQVLLAKAAANRLDCKRASKSQVASALRLWHSFAVEVLAYDPAVSLPPQSGQHVEAFVSVFRNPDTAANYITHLRWACDHLGLAKVWDTDTLKATLRGAKRRRTRLFGGPSGAKRILDKSLFQKLVQAADEAGMEELAVFCLVAWEFLLRVQSECIPLQVGAQKDGRFLPPSRHSGLWVEGWTSVVLKLRLRKNRPQGSLLKRPCTCALAGPRLCLLHRLSAFLRGKAYGEAVWSFTAHSGLVAIRRLLTSLKVANPEDFTFKMFRAGHATALAADGKSLGHILAAGEWKSTAVLSYIDEDAVDAAVFIDVMLAESDGE